MAADHGVGQVHILDFGLQLAVMTLGHLAAEDRGDLIRLPDGPVGVEEPIAKLVECRASMEDQVVAELDLGEEQAMFAAGMVSLECGEERCEAGEPFLATGDQIMGRELVGKLLQSVGLGATHEGIGALTKVDALRTHPVRQPVMLIEVDPRREG